MNLSDKIAGLLCERMTDQFPDRNYSQIAERIAETFSELMDYIQGAARLEALETRVDRLERTVVQSQR